MRCLSPHHILRPVSQHCLGGADLIHSVREREMTLTRMLPHFAVAALSAAASGASSHYSPAEGTPASPQLEVAVARAEAARATSARTYSSIVDLRHTGDEPLEIQW